MHHPSEQTEAEGFAIIAALLLVVSISIMAPQIASLSSDISRGGGRVQATIDAQSSAKSVFSSAHAQLIAHTGLPLAWQSGADYGGDALRERRAKACFYALYPSDTEATAEMATWLTANAKFSDILHTNINPDNSTYSISAILFDNGTGAFAQTYEAYQVLGCHVRGQPLPTSAAFVGKYAYVGGQLKLLSLFNGEN